MVEMAKQVNQVANELPANAGDGYEAGNPKWEQYPVSVELRFRTKEQRDEFMGGLSDGFGENFCELEWPWKNAPRLPSGAIVGFEDQPRFAVDLPYDTNEFNSWEEFHASEEFRG
jgi:hypothetical protein